MLTVPYEAHGETLRAIAEAVAGKVLVDVTVPLKPPKVSRVQLPAGLAAALEAQALVGPSTPVVATLHHVSATHVADPAHAIECDVLVAADDARAKATVIGLVRDLGTARPGRGTARQRHRPRVAHARLDSSEPHLQEPGGGDRVHGPLGRREEVARIRAAHGARPTLAPPVAAEPGAR